MATGQPSAKPDARIQPANSAGIGAQRFLGPARICRQGPPACAHPAPGVAKRRFGDLLLAAREIVIERAFRRFAARDDLVDPGRGIAGLAEKSAAARTIFSRCFGWAGRADSKGVAKTLELYRLVYINASAFLRMLRGLYNVRAQRPRSLCAPSTPRRPSIAGWTSKSPTLRPAKQKSA